MVSSVSAFDDDIWDLDQDNPASSKNAGHINWGRIAATKKTPETIVAGLRRIAKQTIYLLMTAPPRGRKPLRPSTARGAADQFIYLVQWMARNGYHRFAQLDDVIVARYLRYRREQVEKSKRKNPQRHLFSAVGPLKQLSFYPKAILDQPAWHVSSTTLNVARRYQSREEPPAESVPMEIAIPYVTTAVKWVREYGPTLLEAFAVVQKALVPKRGLHPTKSSIDRYARRALIDYAASKPYPDEFRCAFETGNIKQLHVLLVDLETAAGIVLQSLTGVRTSELVTFTNSSRRERRLDDGRVLLLLRGELIKTSPTPRALRLEWVAGFKDEENPVDIAFSVLRSLRTISPRKTLPNLLQNFNKTARPLSGPTWNHRLNTFNCRRLGLEWHFASHQFRRTFARFVAVGNKNALFALQRHFKHVSYVMTDIYAGTDTELLALVQDERSVHLAELLEQLVGATSLAGKLGDSILSVNHKFRGRAGMNVRREFVRSLLDNSDLSVVDLYYGLCVRLLDRAKCQAIPDRIGISNCASCENLMVGKPHEPFWKARVSDNQSLLSVHGEHLLPEARQSLIDIISEAQIVLRKIQSDNG